MNQIIIKQCTLDERNALEIRTIMAAAMPMAPLNQPEEMLISLQRMIRGYEQGTIIAERDGEMIGFIMLMRGPSPELARLMGAVLPTEQNTGIGKLLWDRLCAEFIHYPSIKHLQCRTFGSMHSSRAFLERIGCQLSERIFWHECSVDQVLSPDLQSKLEQLKKSSITVISAQEYQSIRTDWEQALWRLETETSRDVPTELGVMHHSFEEWQKMLKTSTSDLSKILIAMDGDEAVGLLKLGDIQDECMNINFTAVAATHRRQGISLLLKLTSFELARSLGVKRISTQNHSLNQAIINANLSFGFSERDQILDYIYALPES